MCQLWLLGSNGTENALRAIGHAAVGSRQDWNGDGGTWFRDRADANPCARASRLDRAQTHLVTLAAPGLGAGCLLLVTTTSLQAVLPAQAIIAITTILMPPSIAAVSVGLVGHGPSLNRWAATEYIRYQADSGKFYTLRAALKVLRRR